MKTKWLICNNEGAFKILKENAHKETDVVTKAVYGDHMKKGRKRKVKAVVSRCKSKIAKFSDVTEAKEALRVFSPDKAARMIYNNPKWYRVWTMERRPLASIQEEFAMAYHGNRFKISKGKRDRFMGSLRKRAKEVTEAIDKLRAAEGSSPSVPEGGDEPLEDVAMVNASRGDPGSQ